MPSSGFPLESGHLATYQPLARNVAGVLGDVCVLRTPDAHGENLVVRKTAATGGNERLNRISLLLVPGLIGEGVTGQVYRTGDTFLSDIDRGSADTPPSVEQSFEKLRSHGVRSLLVMPPQGHGERLGAITLLRVVEVVRVLDGTLPVFCLRDKGGGFDAEYADKLIRLFERLHTLDE